MNDDKEQRNIELAADHEVSRLLHVVTRNWEVAQSRMAQITQERKEGIYDDNGVEVMAVYVRMSRVYDCLVRLVSRPQAFLLPSVIESLRPLAIDQSMDGELVRLLRLSFTNEEVETADLWTKSGGNHAVAPQIAEIVKNGLTKTIGRYVIPHLPPEEMQEAAVALGDMVAQTQVDTDGKQDDGGLFAIGGKLSAVVAENRLLMAIVLLLRHEIIEMICRYMDITLREDIEVANVFEQAKQQLLESDAWREYWSNHKQHLERKGGSLDKQWKEDAEEVEKCLMDMRGYIYNKWNESPEAFGQALKQQRLDDKDVLQLLFYLTKKDAIVLETEKPDERRENMEENAFEAAMKLHELVADKYYNEYETIWQRIILSENISKLLMDFNSSKYNQGFSMLCLCKIVSHLQSEYKFYGSHTSNDLGKLLGDKRNKISHETISNYIKKKETMLNELCFSEIKEALKINKKNI